MPTVPRYPRDHPSGTSTPGGEPEPTPGARRSLYLWWTVGIVLLVLVVVLHVTGVLGPGGH